MLGCGSTPQHRKVFKGQKKQEISSGSFYPSSREKSPKGRRNRKLAAEVSTPQVMKSVQGAEETGKK